MSDLTVLNAEERIRAGKGAARAARRAGHVPAVVYGGNEQPLLINLDPKALGHELRRPGFYSTQYMIKVGNVEERALARDVQFHPVTEDPLHVDFLRVTERTRVNVDVSVHFIGEEESPGLRRGGVLNVVRHEIEIVAAAGNIPDQIVVNLAGKDINDSIHISEIALPEGVTPTITDRDFTIATIAAPTLVAEEQAAEQAEAEAPEEEELEGEEAEAAEDEGDAEGGEDENKNE